MRQTYCFILVAAAQQNESQVLFSVDSLLEPFAKNKSHYQVINFIENIPLPNKAIPVSLDVCSFYTNILQEEGNNVVCQYYKGHYQSKEPMLVTHVGELMGLILKENSFKFHDKHFLQTHGIALGSKMAVAFAVICMAHVEKQLLAASPQKPT